MSESKENKENKEYNEITIGEIVAKISEQLKYSKTQVLIFVVAGKKALTMPVMRSLLIPP